ncbi:UDP-N-acetylenolpyruvoylglucosamine reductase [Pseudoclavibacter endophyticus]|uniref:UDP-N-acetylenolpyruvoylglucosamine reductase n=1 Tax=Pseudoclavibacter endophyticus TaxID=1778590 RepID=A0A6H9WKR6_9MICO|nr:UDP-N-acetylmuramate dehydrogenase [Pseudoclavibacter endophyticus]KAB1648092.1 UDP-N-acetylmuramate dehydrogenase [Pseudoclavibacter endophyticus]GGA69649.1 UDP-N-acetylenolpyruvoylglucosamine reductase [Pseudoclavibacter endophyticus]
MTVRLADYTTTRVGGPARRFETATTRDELVERARRLFAEHDELVILAGGSNTIAGDDPIDRPVLHIATRGIETVDDQRDDAGTVLVVAEAGEPWVELVDMAVALGFAGIEALAGIPGSVGAAPVQNIGAYGQEVASTLRRIEFYDADLDEVIWIMRDDLGLGYRTSALKRGERRGVVLRVELELLDLPDDLGAPIAYAQLASALGVDVGERLPVLRVRDTVLGLRASKGMVLDASDPDSVSSGSFFVNPVVSVAFARELPRDAPRYAQPAAPDGTELTKLSAAWLIEQSGIGKGFSLPGSSAAISSKHTLAITNRGGATGEEIAELARYVRVRVLGEFGVELQPEPVLLGIEL